MNSGGFFQVEKQLNGDQQTHAKPCNACTVLRVMKVIALKSVANAVTCLFNHHAQKTHRVSCEVRRKPMRQIVMTASNHYDMYDASGDSYPCVELIVTSLEKHYEACATGLRAVESFQTDRYYMRVDQLKQVIEQMQEMVDYAEELREKHVHDIQRPCLPPESTPRPSRE